MAQWIYGKNAVMQILKSKKKVEKALVAEGAKFPEAETLLKNRRIPTQRVSRISAAWIRITRGSRCIARITKRSA